MKTTYNIEQRDRLYFHPVNPGDKVIVRIHRFSVYKLKPFYKKIQTEPRQISYSIMDINKPNQELILIFYIIFKKEILFIRNCRSCHLDWELSVYLEKHFTVEFLIKKRNYQYIGGLKKYLEKSMSGASGNQKGETMFSY